MITVYLGLGSNIEPAGNLRAGLDWLQQQYGVLETSATYQGAAVGFEGDPFWNLVVRLETDQSPGEMARFLRQLEYRMGRPRNATRFSARTLDIDVLLYGELTGKIEGLELPRAEITENAFVLRPLAELAPALTHPLVERTMADIWQDYPAEYQPLEMVELGWEPAV